MCSALCSFFGPRDLALQLQLHGVTSKNAFGFCKRKRERERESVLHNPKKKRQTKCVSMISLSFSYSSAMPIGVSFYLFLPTFMPLFQFSAFAQIMQPFCVFHLSSFSSKKPIPNSNKPHSSFHFSFLFFYCHLFRNINFLNKFSWQKWSGPGHNQIMSIELLHS